MSQESNPFSFATKSIDDADAAVPVNGEVRAPNVRANTTLELQAPPIKYAGLP